MITEKQLHTQEMAYVFKQVQRETMLQRFRDNPSCRLELVWQLFGLPDRQEDYEPTGLMRYLVGPRKAPRCVDCGGMLWKYSDDYYESLPKRLQRTICCKATLYICEECFTINIDRHRCTCRDDWF